MPKPYAKRNARTVLPEPIAPHYRAGAGRHGECLSILMLVEWTSFFSRWEKLKLGEIHHQDLIDIHQAEQTIYIEPWLYHKHLLQAPLPTLYWPLYWSDFAKHPEGLEGWARTMPRESFRSSLFAYEVCACAEPILTHYIFVLFIYWNCSTGNVVIIISVFSMWLFW